MKTSYFLSSGSLAVPLSMGLLCWLTTVQPLLSQLAPQIDAASMEVGRDSVLRFQFRSSSGGVIGDFDIEFTSELTPSPAWTSSQTATLTALAEGLFSVTDPTPAGSRFYRVIAFPPITSFAPLWINEVMSDNVSKLADAEGKYWDWIELYNPNDEAVDLMGYALSDDEALLGKWRFPTQLLQPHGFVLVYASDLNISETHRPLHTNFKLRASGETLVLSDPANGFVDRVEIPALAPDQSMGRTPDGGPDFGFFAKAVSTPGAANSATSLPPLLASPRFVPEGGFFPGSLTVQVQASDTRHTLHYTLDGSPPTSQSPVVQGAVTVGKTTVLRVLAVDGQGGKSEVASRTYLIGVKHSLPVVSIATAPANMEFRNGFLYGMGPSVLNSQNQVLQSYPYSGSNAWKDREVEVAMEFFETGGEIALRQRAGMKVYGGWGSRGYPQKSLALFARRSYGNGSFKHRLFPDLAIDEFESFVLRNSGNDNQSTHQTPPRPPIIEFGPTASYGSYFVNGGFTLMRDAFEQRLLDGTTLDTQGYRPAVVYINGDYWGIFNLREKVTEHQVISHHSLSLGAIDLIEGYGTVRAGNGTVYSQLRTYLTTKSMAVETNFAFVEANYLDIDNFIDYHLAVLYFQNFDIGNIKCWRPRLERGRFRWLVYDQDYGFGLWPASVYLPAMARDYANYDNMFDFYTAGTGAADGWPNAGGRTLMLRSLLSNPGFKERFVRRCADLLNGLFREDRVEQTLQQMSSVIRPEIGAHLNRWSWPELIKRGYGKPHQAEYRPFIQETWETNLTVLSEFGRTRPQKLRQDCIAHFKLKKGIGTLELNVEPKDSGTVQVNTLQLESFPWQGMYFADFPTTLRAVPKPGFRFAGWLTSTGLVASLRLDVTVAATLTNVWVARMEPAAAPSPEPSPLMITEIQYHPAADAESGDWIELQNTSTEPLDLTGWVFRDEEDIHAFALPERTLKPGEFMVLCQDDFDFRLFNPVSVPCVGNFKFGLGNAGDTLRLYRPDGSASLSVSYTDLSPWPSEADGTGFTLELISTRLNSSLPSSWKVSAQKGGTPGRL